MAATRLSILAVTSEVPWPLNSGGHLRTYHLLRELVRSHDVTLIAPGRRDASAEAAMNDVGIELLLTGDPPRGRVGQVIDAVRALAAAEPYVMYRRHRRRGVATSLASRLRHHPPDVIYFDHLDSFVYAGHDGPLMVGDLHNVYSTLLSRTADDQTAWLSRAYLRREAELLALAERRAVSRADLLFAVSPGDRDHLAQLGPAEVVVVPNGVDCAAYADLPTGRLGQAPVMMFLGAMSWAPNAAAAEFLAMEVLPRLRRRVPEARLQIVGRDPSDRLKALAADPAIEVTGAVADVRPYLSGASILAVPLTAGGGTRLKILEAFAAGLPVVSTSVGCEGIDASADQHLVIAEPDGFAEAATEALLDPARLAGLARAARMLAALKYDWSAIGQRASTAIVDAHDRRKAAGQSLERQSRDSSSPAE